MVAVKYVQYQFAPDTHLIFPDWEVSKGEHALIIGPSGCGKTTLLHLIGGLLRPTSGQVQVAGQELGGLGSRQLDIFRGKHIGMVFQKPHLMSSLTIHENLLLPSFLVGRRIDKGRVNQLLDDLGLEQIIHRKVHQVSQGQAQRVAIARSLVNHPEVLLCDEPTASLDDESCLKVVDLLVSQARKHGTTLIMATHDQRVKSRFSNQLAL